MLDGKPMLILSGESLGSLGWCTRRRWKSSVQQRGGTWTRARNSPNSTTSASAPSNHAVGAVQARYTTGGYQRLTGSTA